MAIEEIDSNHDPINSKCYRKLQGRKNILCNAFTRLNNSRILEPMKSFFRNLLSNFGKQ